MSVKVYHRTDCRLCQSNNVELIIKFEPVPLAEKYCATREAAKDIEKFLIDLYMCLDCGHVQLLDVIDSDALWNDYTYYSGQTKGIIDHFADVAQNIITTYQPPTGSLVVDIGSNDGSLLRPFKELGYRVLGIDPAREIAEQASNAGIPTLPEYMSKDLAVKIRNQHGSAAVITAFNVFAHADDLSDMADSIRELMDTDGIFIFECQYLMDLIDKVLLGTIFHEHMSYHSLKPMIKFLEKHGMELIDVQRVSIQKGSLIGTVQLKNGPKRKMPSVAALLALEESCKLDTPEALRIFSAKLENLRGEISNFVNTCKKNGASIAGYGAARSGPTIIAQFSLGSAIEYILDDHPQKTNKFSPGDGIKVLPTSELYIRKPDYTIILAWLHANKIIANNPRYLEEGGKFVVCFPDIEIIDASALPALLAKSVN